MLLRWLGGSVSKKHATNICSLYLSHPMWAFGSFYWGRPGPAKWFSFPSCLPEPSSWLSGCCVKWTDRNLETFLLPTCWDVYNFGLVSEKQTHFGVMYLTHKIFVNRIKPRWIWLTLFFWTWRILGCTTSARRILKAVGFYIEFFQWDGVSHGRLNGTIGCGTALLLFFFRFLKSQRPITENCQGLWNLPKAVILSIYIYAICLEAPHLLQSGIAG